MTSQNPLKALRSQLGLSQAEVATRMGVSQPNYQRWESGAAPIPKAKAKKLAKVLHSTERVVTGAARFAAISPAILDDQDGYWGEATFHFVSGEPAVVVSISAAERRRLGTQLFTSESEFIEAVGLCNETYLIRRSALSDAYLSDEAVDTVSPAEQECQEFVPIPLVDDRLWDVLSNYNQESEELGEFPREQVAEALSYFMTPDEVLAELAMYDDEGEPEEATKSADEWLAQEMFRRLGIPTSGVDSSTDLEERELRKRFLLSRATDTVIRLSRGAERRLMLTREGDLADNYLLLGSLGGGEAGVLKLWPDDDQVGMIRTEAVDWVRFPKHYLRRALEGLEMNLYGYRGEVDG